MVTMYQGRSGSPEEFCQALYAVSRELQVSETAVNSSPHCSNGACGSQSGSSKCGNSPSGSQNSSQSSSSPLHSVKKSLWESLSPWRTKHEDSDTSGKKINCFPFHFPNFPIPFLIFRYAIHPRIGSDQEKNKSFSWNECR